MRMDVNKWAEVPLGERLPINSGVIHVKATTPVSVFAFSGEAPVLIGTGHEVRCTIDNAFSYEVQGAKNTRAFSYEPELLSNKPQGDIHTNVDRQPMDSGNLLEVKRAHRLFKLEAAQTMESIRRAQREMLAKRPTEDVIDDDADDKSDDDDDKSDDVDDQKEE